MKRTLLGMLTPSSNTILEPLTSAMVAGVPGVSAHFGRFRVTEISLKSAALGQFDDAPVLEAAKLLPTRTSMSSAGTARRRVGWDSTPIIDCATGSPRKREFRRARRCSR